MSDPRNLVELFFNAVDRFSTKRAALRYKANGVWHDITHQELSRRVHHTALGLLQLGVEREERVGILSPNRPDTRPYIGPRVSAEPSRRHSLHPS